MRTLFLALALLVAAPVAAMAVSPPAPIHSVNNRAYTNPYHQDPAQVITAALTARLYVVSASAPGSIDATYSPRDIRAVIRVTWTDTTYSINYVDSSNLRYDGTRIDPHYNRWINNLDHDLQRAFNTAPGTPAQ